ncbi:MAG: hypothetical protein HZA79_01230 [Sphingobacteriales bacterium]|nr:hypothetical protein [Sphingobacteriales bacterium]
MTQRDNILEELRDSQSPLANDGGENVYVVPAGYFEGLAEQVLRRIRASASATAAEELGHLSPLLSQLPKTMPYSVPAGYFEGLESTLVPAAMYGEQDAKEELENSSPLLSGLKKEMPYSVPAGYFENLVRKEKPLAQPAAKIVSLGSRNWFRYAAAAVVTGVIVLTVVLFNGKSVTINPNENSHEWVKKNTEKIKTDNIEEFIQLTTEEERGGQESIAATEPKIKEVKELIKDIPETELRDFLKDTEVLDDPNTNDASDESMKP